MTDATSKKDTIHPVRFMIWLVVVLAVGFYTTYLTFVEGSIGRCRLDRYCREHYRNYFDGLSLGGTLKKLLSKKEVKGGSILLFLPLSRGEKASDGAGMVLQALRVNPH